MSAFNKIIPVRQKWVYPQEGIQLLEVNSQTDAEGSIILDYDNILQLNSSTVEIFLATPPLVPITQYTKTGINLNTGPEFTLDNVLLNSGRVQLEWKFNTVVLGVTDGDFYVVTIIVNGIVKVVFIVKIVDIEV